MVSVLSRLLLQRPSINQCARTFARTAKNVKNDEKLQKKLEERLQIIKSWESSKSPLVQTCKQFIFCFVAMLPLAYFTAGGEAIEGKNLSFAYFFETPCIQWDYWGKKLESLGISDTLINRRVVQIIALNCVCSIAFPLIVAARPQMVYWFSSGSVTAAFSPLTSMMLHGGPLHLIGNMIGLYALTIGWNKTGPPAHGSLSDVSYNQLTFLLFSAGMVSAVLCSARSLLTGSRNLSVGFSNALYALAIFEFVTKPEARMGVIFFNFNFSAQEAVYAVLTIELLLLLFSRYHRLDSLGHLMGALYGWWYARKGKVLWTDFRDAIDNKLPLE